jgi:hypothetical protein
MNVAAAVLVLGFTGLAACGADAHDAADLPGSPLSGAGGAAPGAPAPDEVSWLIGEVHLHQFPVGSDQWAAFVEPPVGIHEVQGQSITETDTQATLVDGPCTAFVLPACTPACGASEYCWAPDDCRPFPRWGEFDAGSFAVDGSAVQPGIRFWFDPLQSRYASAPPAGSDEPLFAGGEPLTLRGGSGDWTATTEVPAPAPVVLQSPSPSTPLHFPSGGSWEIRWQAGGGDEMDVYLSVSAGNAPGVQARCVTGDAGFFVVPAAVVALFPAPPRQVRLELQRSEQRVARATRPGYGVLFHVAFSAWMNGED